MRRAKERGAWGRQTFKRFKTASENVSNVNIKYILNRNCKALDTLESNRLLDQSL